MRTDQSDGGGRPANRLRSRTGSNRTQDLLRGGRLARIGGTVVSFAPMAGAVGVMMSVSALAIAALGVLSGDAKAQDCTESNNLYTCSGGEISSTKELTETGNTSLTVTIASDASFNVSTGDALKLTSSGGIYLKQEGSGDISAASAAAGIAINAYNNTAGDVSIMVTGSVQGGKTGIKSIIGSDGSGTMTINAVNVTGSGTGNEDAGIFAQAQGSNPIAITATGSVVGAKNGIHVETYSSNATAPVTIAAATVTGSRNGIRVNASAAGNVSVTATGHVSASDQSNGVGIYVGQPQGTPGTVSIFAATVAGTKNGIHFNGGANGDIRISATGHVTAANADGAGIRVFVGSAQSSKSITVTAANVTAGKYGIHADVRGTGDVNVTTTGTVSTTAADGEAIFANIGNTSNGGAVTVTAENSVSGGRAGIHANNSGPGTLAVSASGLVQGRIGIDASVSSGAMTVTAAAVTGSSTGIKVVSTGTGAISVNATGAVMGTGAGGVGIDALGYSNGAITITAAAVTGSAVGIKAVGSGTGTISVKATQTVTGTGTAGVQATGGATTGAITIDVATVTSGSTGIHARQASANALNITASGMVTGRTAASGIGIDAQSSSAGALSVNVAAVTGGGTGIKAVGGGAGDVTVNATGTVTGGIGIDASASGGDVTVSAATVTATNIGIKVASNGTGNVKIMPGTGAIMGTNRGIDANNSAGGSIAITVTGTVSQTNNSNSLIALYAKNEGTATASLTISTGDVEGELFGIRAVNEGTGAIAVTATGLVKNRVRHSNKDAAIKVENRAQGAGGISVTLDKKPGAADDAVSIDGPNRGISVYNRAGPTSVIVTGEIVGESNGEAVYVKGSTASGDVTILLRDRVRFGTGVEVKHEGTGNVSITVGEMRGREPFEGGTRFYSGPGIYVKTGGDVSITASGHVDSGGTGVPSIRSKSSAGKPVTVTLNSGALLDGGVADDAGNATVTVNAGATVRRAVHLGGGTDTLRIAGGSVRGSLSGVETITVESGAQLTVLGSASASTLSVSGSLSMVDDAGSGFNVNGDFTGGGTITLDANFTVKTPEFDSLTIAGNVTGVTAVNINQFGTGSGVGRDRPYRLDLITVQGTVAATAFTIETIRFAYVDYSLERDTSNNQTVFYLKRTGNNQCLETFDESGVFICSGGRVIDTQELDASGGTDLNVTLNPETPVIAGPEHAFKLTQPGPADIVFVQSAEGQAINGLNSGIVAENTSGGSISINVNGSVTGEGDDGIRASNDSSGTGIAIIAGSVFGAKSGIEAIGSGTGGVSVTATSAVVGTADDGIYAKTGLSGTGLTVSAEAVTGGKVGIKAIGSGTGGVSVIAAGAVVGTADYGIYAKTGVSGTGLTVSAGTVTGGKVGIKAVGSGSGGVSVTATGVVVGTANYGIHAVTGSSGTGLTVAAGSVTSGSVGIRAIGSGTGSLSVTATGAVVGTANYGIFAMTAPAGTNLTVSAAAVTGGKVGIKAVGSGSGTVTVAATGKVTGSGTAGVMVSGGTGTGDMTVSVATVSGAKGIDARQTGTGALNIMAAGTVTGASGTGIYGLAGTSAGTLTITAAAVTGQGSGIKIVGSGANDVTASASGDVSAVGANAIGVEAMTSGGGDMSITVASVTGVKHGIMIESNGAGAASISASGSVTATANDGIGVNSVAGANAGDLTIRLGSVMAKQGGVKVVGSGAGDVTVNAGGSVRVEGNSNSSGWGVDALVEGSGDLSVTLGSVTADVLGVKAISSGAGSVSVAAAYVRADEGNSAVAVQASGGTSTSGVAVAVGTAYANRIGIDVQHAGTGELSVTATGAVTGKMVSGIKAVGSNKADVRIHAEKLVESSVDGINASVSGSGDLTINVASVTGKFHGIKAENTGTGGVSIDASGVVTGVDADGTSNPEIGILATVSGAGALRIAASSVTGGNIGIEARSDGAGAVSVVSTGLVSGSNAGIKARGGASTASVAVTAATVTSSSGIGIDAQQEGAGALTVAATETASGTWGILAVGSGDGAVSVSTAGTVTGTSEHGIEARGKKAVSVAATAAAVGEKIGILAMSEDSGSVSVMASGAVTGKSGHGIHASAEDTGISVAVASVTGEDRGILAENKGSGLVSVMASGAVTGKSMHGIEARSKGGGVTVEAAAVMGEKNGILVVNEGTGSVRVVASGSVTTSDSGEHGVHATNSSGAAISIETRGAVTAKKNGIFAVGSSGEVMATASAAVKGGSHGVRVEAASGIDLTLNEVIGENGSGVHAANSSSGNVAIALSRAVEGRQSGSHGIHAVNQGAQSGAMSIRGESAATVSGTQSGVFASNRGSGQLTIDLRAAVTGEEGHGIHATNSGSGITIRAGSASGAMHGIFATGAAGQLRIDATGSVAGSGTQHDGIHAINNGSGQTDISVSGSVSGEKSGIRAENTYSYSSRMTVEVARSASVSGKVDGIRLSTKQEEGAISLVVTGSVEGGSGFGVRAEAGDAPIMVDVAGSVTGTSDSGGGAVRIDNGAGRNLAQITVRSGGLIDAGSGTAIWNGDGNAAVRTDGGRIRGRIALGGGDDQFIWNGGNLNGITELDAGERAGNDRIRILSDMSAEQTKGLLEIEGIRNWDEISIEGGATAAFLGGDNADITLAALRIKENATVTFVDSSPDDRIAMRGDLIGEGGTLEMDVSFSEEAADSITLDGGTARGTTVISTVNPSGDVPSVDKGIVLVRIIGDQNVAKSAFELSAASARRGLFENTLTRESQNGETVFTIKTSNRLGEFGTVLQMSPALVRGAFKNLPRRPYDSAEAGGAQGNRAPWLKVGAQRLNIGPSEMREEASSDVFRLEGGMDLMQAEGAGGTWTFGVSAHHTTMSGRTTVDGGNGSVDMRAFGIGATASWRGDSNYFFNAAGHVNMSKSDMTTDGNGTLVRDAKMDARVVGAAAGRRVRAGAGIYIVPEIEIAYGQVSGDEFTAQNGIVGTLGSSNLFTVGVGGRVEFPTRGGSAYLSGSIVEDFSSESNVSAGGFNIAVEEDPMEVRLGFGGYREVGEGARLMLEGTHVFSVGGDSGKRVSGGLSGGIRWDW